MALAPNWIRNSLNDENSLPAGKIQSNGVQGAGRAGLKQQHGVSTSERRVLSNISNSKPLSSSETPKPERKILSDISNAKSLSSFGAPRPSPRSGLATLKKSENLPVTKPAGLPLPQSSQKSSQSGSRIALRDVGNELNGPPSSLTGLQQSQRARIEELQKKIRSNVKLTDEQLRQCEEWAKEDLPVEQTHFTGDEMEKLRVLRMESDIDVIVSMVRNYDPARLPRSSKPPMKFMDSIFSEDGLLKPDVPSCSFDEQSETSVVEPYELDAVKEDLELVALASRLDDPDYPSIPEDWRCIV